VAEPELIEFRPEQPDVVVARMITLARDHAGWINFQPGIPSDAVGDTRSSLFGLFSGRGPDVPVCTWTPGARRRRGFEPASVGIQHGTGPNGLNRLRDAGWELPAGWRRLQDHSRRGLVLALPPDTPPAEVLRWLLGAGAALSVVPLTGSWLASIFLAL